MEQTTEIESRKTIGYREMKDYIYKPKSARELLVRLDEQLSNVNFFVFLQRYLKKPLGKLYLLIYF